MTRVLRKTPAPIMLVTLTAMAAHVPTPRVNSGRVVVVETALLAIGVVSDI
jgi:hypothetical protein